MTTPSTRARSSGVEDVHLRAGARTAWQTLTRSGLVAPEAPAVVFVAVANSTGFWWGLAVGALGVLGVAIAAVRRGWSSSAPITAGVALAIAATVARLTGVAAGGLVVDVCLDLALAVLLGVSIVVRRPAFALVWGAVRRRNLLHDPSPSARAGYDFTTGIAALALAVRAAALGLVLLNDEPVFWLLTVRVVLGLPVTLVVIAAAYAAKELDPDSGKD